MADENYVIPANSEYDPNIRQLKNSDPANAEQIFNPLIQKLIENIHSHEIKITDIYDQLANKIDSLQKAAANGIAPLDRLMQVPVSNLNYAFTKEQSFSYKLDAQRYWSAFRLEDGATTSNTSIAWFDGVFVIVKQGARSAYTYISCDGARWVVKSISHPINANAWEIDHEVQGGNEIFLIANSNGAATFTPHDAKMVWNKAMEGENVDLPYLTYELLTSGNGSTNPNKLFFYNNYFYIFRDNGTVIRTTNGTDMIIAVNAVSGKWIDFCCSDSYYVALRDDGIVATCPVGSSTWTVKSKFSNISTTGTTEARGIEFVNNTFVMFYYNNSGKYTASYYATNPTGSWTYKFVAYLNYTIFKTINDVLYLLYDNSLRKSTDLGVTVTSLGIVNAFGLQSSVKLLDFAISDAGTIVVSTNESLVFTSSQGIPVSYQERQYLKGYYTGNGTASRTIELGFKPSLVIVFGESTISYKTDTLCITLSRYSSYASYPTAKSYLLTDSGFQVGTSDGYSTSYNTNLSGTRYEYIVFR